MATLDLVDIHLFEVSELIRSLYLLEKLHTIIFTTNIQRPEKNRVRSQSPNTRFSLFIFVKVYVRVVVCVYDSVANSNYHGVSFGVWLLQTSLELFLHG